MSAPLKNPALAKFVKTIKNDDKAKRDPGFALQNIIDKYCLSGAFDDYLETHAAQLAEYVNPRTKRQGRWRASGAGKCLQAQAFAVYNREFAERHPHMAVPVNTNEVERPARQMRALANGTFTHLRYHLMFDDLHERGLVETVAKEALRYNARLGLSGTIDRVIRYNVEGGEVHAVVDFKSMRHRYFDQLLTPQFDHIMQQHAYMLFEHDAPYWCMLYECKDEHDLKVYVRKYDDTYVSLLHGNYLAADTWVDHALQDQPDTAPLPMLPLITDWCSYCEFNKACLKLRPDRPTVISASDR